MSQNQQKPNQRIWLAGVATGNVNCLPSSTFSLFVLAVWQGSC